LSASFGFRFVIGAGKFQHITPVLRDVLHWLPVHQRILYEVAATAFDCIRGTGPAYFKHVCTPASDISGRAHLCSAERRDMLVPLNRNWAQPTEFSSCCTDRLELSSGTSALDTD